MLINKQAIRVILTFFLAISEPMLHCFIIGITGRLNLTFKTYLMLSTTHYQAKVVTISNLVYPFQF